MRSVRLCRAACLLFGVGAFGSQVLGQPRLILAPQGSTTISPGGGAGGQVTIEAQLDDVLSPKRLRAYQTTMEIVPQAGSTGTLGLVDPAAPDPNPSIFVTSTRTDWVFFGLTSFKVTNPPEMKVAASLLDPAEAPSVPDTRYLATYILQASSNASGNFLVRFKPVNPSDPGVLFNQLLDQDNMQMSFTLSPASGITVTVVTRAPNDACASAVTIGDGVTAFNSTNATTDGPSHPGSGCDTSGTTTVSNDLWYNYTATCSGVLTASTCGSANFDTRVAIYNACSCPLADANLLSCNDNFTGCSGSTSVAVASGVASGICYKIRVGATGNLTGVGSLTIACIPNDLCASAQALTLGTTVSGSTRGLSTNDALGPNCGQGVVGAPGVWYTVAGTGDRMRAELTANSYDTRLTVYSGTCAGLTCVADANSAGSGLESVTWCSTLGTTYRILVHGATGASGTFSVRASGASCDDSNACTDNICTAGVCSNPANYDTATFCCAPSNRTLTVINDNNPCTTDVCNAGTGAVTHPAVPNGPNVGCDDEMMCTLDECFTGQCRYTDINTIACTTNANCPPDTICGDGTGGTTAGRCFCQSGPRLELISQAGSLPVAGCYQVGDQITVRVEMGAAEDPVVGAQLFLEYEPAALDFVSIQPGSSLGTGSPFALELFEQANETLGRIDYQIGLSLGSPPTLGPAPIAVIRFNALAECSSFLRFRATGPAGQPNLLTGPGGAEIVPVLIARPALKTDLTPPVLAGCPSDRSVLPDPGLFSGRVSWTAPTATDSCDPGPLAVTCTPASGSVFPSGTTTVTCRATDSCGLSNSSCTFYVSVESILLGATVQLSPSTATGPFNRCVTFDLWDCNGPPQAQHVTIQQTMGFTSGVASGVIPLPGGAWECATARDRLHTLRSTAPDFGTLNGINYTASFEDARELGGHWLVSGNLNDDGFIDILDFGVLFPMHLSLANPNTACGTAGPDGNINGDNLVDLLDLVIFIGNTFKASETNCCASAGSVANADGPIMSITVEELRELGLEEMISADVNRDGVLDVADVSLVLQGSVPPADDGPTPEEPTPVKPQRRRPSKR